MWANHITRNLNRSTWSDAVLEPPPDYIAHLLRAANSQIEQQLSSLSRSAHLALDCVNASIADYQQLRQDWEAFGRRLDVHGRSLSARKSIIDAFLLDVNLPPAGYVIDPLPRIENLDDFEHAP